MVVFGVQFHDVEDDWLEMGLPELGWERATDAMCSCGISQGKACRPEGLKRNFAAVRRRKF